MLQYIGGKPFYLFQGNLPDTVEKEGCVRAISGYTIQQLTKVAYRKKYVFRK